VFGVIGHTPARHTPRLTPDRHSCRPVDWRWERAAWLVARRRPRRPEDRWVQVAMKFIRRLAATKSEAAYERLAAAMPGVFWAHYWREGHDRVVRAMLDAYILARATPAQAAVRCGLSPETGVAYACLFFDVADRLDQRGFIYNEAIGRQVHSGLTETDYATYWKLLGYQKGAAFLDTLISKDSVKELVDDDQGHIDRAGDDVVRDFLRFKSIITAQVVSPTRDADAILTAHRGLKELRQADAGGAATQTGLRAYTLAQSMGLANTYGGPAEPPKDAPASELRASEQLAKTLGIETGQVFVGEDIKYPEGGEPK
jgi:hypothetical protein